jgi:hypothetical protein
LVSALSTRDWLDLLGTLMSSLMRYSLYLA